MPDKGECWGVGPLYSVKGATMGACEGECWGVSSGPCAQWKGLPWVHVRESAQVVSHVRESAGV